jgi:hypothetical protein
VKVCELKIGMLVSTSGNWEITHADWPVFLPTKNKKDFKRVEKGSIGITVTHAWKREPKKDVMVFVGTSEDDFQWGGVKRHHNFLWRGKGVIMTGYDMRYLEEIKDQNNE